MNDKSERAAELFAEGYNCSQAVLLAYADEVGLSFDEAARLASSFGGGMGHMGEVCGAVSAMFMVAGLKAGYAVPDDPELRKAHYARIRALAERFKEQNGGTMLCRELLELLGPNEDGTPSQYMPQNYKRRPCERFVKSAAKLIAGEN